MRDFEPFLDLRFGDWYEHLREFDYSTCCPPTFPATMVEHDLLPGGRVGYFMTGPGGDRHAG